MEPFTFIIAEYGQLWELRWDEKKLHILELDANDSHIWASCTLYDEEFQQKRRDWFEDWKKEAAGHFSEKILDFHFNAGEGDVWNDVQMNRNEKVKTIGITRVEKAGSSIKMIYFDLIKQEDMEAEVRLNSLNYGVVSHALLT